MLSAQETALLELALEKNDPNIVSDWFIRHENSGTLYKPDNPLPYWQEKYRAIYEPWIRLGKPNYFGFIEGGWQSFDRAKYRTY
ncbi:MAG TPA: hypothetical protein PLZ51_25045, partial [Aggregatilineales bacterium]|nr:hypothetical protein [Aggregatilineales bacterium]